MKYYLVILFPFVINFCIGQCVICSSLEEALIEPKKAIYLDLSASGVSAISFELNELVNLEELNLSDNQIIEIEFGKLHLPKLRYLNLSNNPGYLAASIDGISASIPKLKRLDLSGNSIELIGNELAELMELEELNLSDNNLKSFPSSFDKMKKLRVLNLENNKLENEPLLFSQLWSLEYLNIAGNSKLLWNGLTSSLLFKDSLKTVKTSLKMDKNFPKNFKNLGLNKLHISNTNFSVLSNAIAMNDSVRSIILEKCTIENPSKFYAWLARFKNLKTLEFKDMEIPTGISKLEKLTVLIFDHCSFEDKLETSKIKPQIEIISRNSEISIGEYIGNAQKGRSVKLEESNYQRINSLQVIKEIEVQKFTINGNDSVTLNLGFSKYEIPQNAFLDGNGNIFTGEVNVGIKELNDPIKNALAGVPMVFNNGSDQLFGSSGMIDFRASDANGNTLFPNPDKIISVELIDVQPSKTNDLYVFNESQRNWQVIGTPSSTSYDSLRKAIMDSLSTISDVDLVGSRIIPIAVQIKYTKKRHDPTKLEFTYSEKAPINSILNTNKKYVYTKNLDQREICNLVWKMDTVSSERIDSLFRRTKYEQRWIEKELNKRGRYSYSYIPRLITDLNLTPNIERDNYILSFNYRDKAYQIPVYQEINGGIESIQRKEKRFYEKYKKKKALASKEEIIAKKLQDDFVKEYADIQRNVILNNLLRSRSYLQEEADKLRFGLTSFGLVNCDYFTRNRPLATIKLDSIAIDQNGQEVYVPFDIRIVVLDDNTFVSSNERSFPIFGKLRSISIFALGALEVCVIKAWKKMSNGLFKAEVYRFSTEDLSSDEIRKKIVES